MILKFMFILLCICLCVGLIVYLIKDVCKQIKIRKEVGEIIDRCGKVAKQVEKKQLGRRSRK